MRVAAKGVGIDLHARSFPIFRWDEQAMRMVSGVEKTIVALDLDCQGEFISLTNALQMQLESGTPVPEVVRLLADAILALAQARGLPHHAHTDLAGRLSALNDRVATTSPKPSAR